MRKELVLIIVGGIIVVIGLYFIIIGYLDSTHIELDNPKRVPIVYETTEFSSGKGEDITTIQLLYIFNTDYDFAVGNPFKYTFQAKVGGKQIIDKIFIIFESPNINSSAISSSNFNNVISYALERDLAVQLNKVGESSDGKILYEREGSNLYPLETEVSLLPITIGINGEYASVGKTPVLFKIKSSEELSNLKASHDQIIANNRNNVFYSYTIGLGVIAISGIPLGWLGIILFNKTRKGSSNNNYSLSDDSKTQHINETISYPPFRDKESKTKYHEHLVKDICKVLEVQIKSTNSSYTISLYNLPEEKKNVILSHFFTAENDSEKYRALYTNFRSLLEFERNMISKARKVYAFLEEVERDLINLHFKYNSNTEYILNNFTLSFGISNKTDLIDIFRMKDAFEKIAFPGIKPIDNFKIEEEYIVRINHKDVFKSSSYDISEKCKLMLIKKIETLEKLVSDVWIAMNVESFARINQYDTTIKNYYEFIMNGEPITGSCIGCLQYFIGTQKSKFERLLAKFEDEKEDLAKI